MNPNFTINIFGDICLTNHNLPLFESKIPQNIFNGITNILNEGDLNIANLEAPVKGKDDKPILKTGPSLHITEDVIELLALSNFHILSLANNHILDFGSKAVTNTIKLINKNGLDFVGAGIEETEVKKPVIWEKGNLTLGIMAFAEHEFNTIDNFDAGANGFDVFESFEDIRSVKKTCNYLVVIFHGGIEHYKYPSPLLQKKCRKIIESGANLVVCQHSHCIGSMENYKNGTILYGQGNSVFGYKEGNDNWNEGLIVQIRFFEDSSKINFIPTYAKIKGGIDLMNGQKKLNCISDFNKRSNQIFEKNFIEKEWINFCNTKRNKYLSQFYGKSKYFNKLNKISKFKLLDFIYSKKDKIKAHNIIRCESHHEVMNTIFENDYLK